MNAKVLNHSGHGAHGVFVDYQSVSSPVMPAKAGIRSFFTSC